MNGTGKWRGFRDTGHLKGKPFYYTNIFCLKISDPNEHREHYEISQAY